MKIYLLFLFLCLSNPQRVDLEQYGLFQIVADAKQCDKDKTLNLDVSNVTVHFYDFSKNFSTFFTIHNAAKGILGIPNLDIKKRFTVYAAGSTSTITSYSIEVIRDAFRDLPNNYFIAIDYIAYTTDTVNQKHYDKSVLYSYYIGNAMAGMLTGFRKGGIPSKNMHGIGYSLGGQIFGYTAQRFFENTGGKLWRVTALDPAGPCFSNDPIREQVRAGIADYVEVYHCNADGYGTDSVLADIDFYLNHKGKRQPNCGTPFILNLRETVEAASCNHVTCIEEWATTVKHPDKFIAFKCESYQMFQEGRCSGNNSTRPGFWNPGTAKGTYYYYTDEYEPQPDFHSGISREVAMLGENRL